MHNLEGLILVACIIGQNLKCNKIAWYYLAIKDFPFPAEF